MELLFTWIENYRNIHNQGINFSSEFNIFFNHEENALYIENRPTHIPSFFGRRISNISVIVGENGTGKTSILNIGEATFYLGRKGSEYFIVCKKQNLLDKISLPTINKQTIKKYNGSDYRDTLIVRYSNFIDSYIEELNSGLFRSDSFYDFSTNRLVREISNFNNEDFNGISYNNNNPFVRQIKSHLSEIGLQTRFLLKDENHKKLKFRTPEVLNVRFNIDVELKYLVKLFTEGGGFGDKKYYKDVEEILSNFLKNQLPKQFKQTNSNSRKDLELKVSDKEYALFLLRWSMFLSFINSFSAPNISSNGPDQWLGFDNNWKTKSIEDWFNYFFTNYIVEEGKSEGSKYYPQILAWANNAIRFVEQFEELLDSRLVTFEYMNPSPLVRIHPDSYGLDLTLKIDISNIDYRSFLYQRLVSNYENIQDPAHWRNDNREFLSYSWRGLSTGEIAMLRLFSRFNNLRYIIKNRREVESPGYYTGQISNLLFLIDEGEIGLHPTWQQQFLSLLIDNLPLMFEDLGISSIQLILSTHSPFILSDVPNHHVIFLEKNESGKCMVTKNPLHDKKMTFGANIHSLLSDGFFMRDGLIGDFAKKKINQLVDDLIESNNQLSPQRKTEIQSIIPLIGEPIIRKKIFDLYNEKINLNIDDRIQTLEEFKSKLEQDIKILKAKQDDSNKKK